MLVLVSTWTAGGREVDGADFLFCWFSLSLSFGMIPSGSSRFSFLFNFFAIDLLSDLFRFMPRFFKCSSLFCSLMTHSRGSIGGNGVAPIASPFVKDFHSFFSPIVSLVRDVLFSGRALSKQILVAALASDLTAHSGF